MTFRANARCYVTCMLAFALWILLASRDQPADYAHTVLPILEAKCRPCHFAGGKMHDRLPFDRQETIVKLNTKLFTRIKDEKEQAVIRRFLASVR